MEGRDKNTIVLFDVDGTLAKAMNKIEQPMIDALFALKQKVYVGVVGGSNFAKIAGQLGEEVYKNLDFFFSENGLYSLKGGEVIHKANLSEHLGEQKLKEFINFCLRYLADLDIPIKRGTFVEYRNGMLNISPIGRNCSQEERDEFEKYDKEHNVRKNFIAALEDRFKDLSLKYSIGGQISFDVFPKGWDKTYCLQFVEEFPTIHFFGDKTFQGGNDYEIYTHPKVIGHSVKDFNDTIKQLNELFLKKE